jgi:cytochrome c oxidase subunit 2
MNWGLHDALQAMGPQAGHIVDLWRVFLVVCSLVFGAILAALLLALKRAPRSRTPEPADLSTLNRPEPGPRRSVVTAVVASVLLLLVLLAASVFTDRALARLPLKDAVNIEVTGHQWWWSVRYINGPVSESFETANEIHVPVGRPVIVKLNSDDVIHSLWIPNLHGKKDLIPGRIATHLLRADRPGVFRGQCAEFCGYQHAWMSLLVVAESPEEYAAWEARQRMPAPEPVDARTAAGRTVFETGTCAMCHTVEGTRANARKAPDLTHVASRMTLAAATLDNTPANRAAWITDPQRFKPGANMPAHNLPPESLDALLRYLDTLK